MKIIKIDRGNIQIEIQLHILRIQGEAMLPKRENTLSEYVIYKNSLTWLHTENPPVINKEELFSFLRKELFTRNMLLVIE